MYICILGMIFAVQKLHYEIAKKFLLYFANVLL